METKPTISRTYDPQAVRRQYRRVAWFYDLWSRLTEARALGRLVDLSGVQDGCRILEVAVGTGRLFAALVSRNSTGENVGLDLSPAMLARARRRLARSAPGGPYRLGEGSAYDLPYESETFDYLFNTYMLDLLPAEDHPRLLREFRRVLKPGGALALAYFSFGTGQSGRFWIWLASHFPSLLTGCRPIRLEAELPPLDFRILHHEQISQSGFPSAILVARKEGRA